MDGHDTGFPLFAAGAACLVVEPEAYEGVRRVAAQVGEDIRLVTGTRPAACASPGEVPGPAAVLAATAGRSPLLERLAAEGRISLAGLAGRREVFLLQRLRRPFPELPALEQVLVVAGSDKRGTEYGLFALSERCGVSPLVWWGDAAPQRRERIAIDLPEPFLSREPSVRYRGFFINDEWPAFGRWAGERFGGVNARCYEQVFLLLLRLRGNYLWPAMWRSVFSEDGPGLASAQLADIYGVIMGTSHHEPLCRAGEEWKRVWRNYGDNPQWSFVTNGEAISKFWEDGVLRNRAFENVITVGMRGEDDSKLLGEDATVADNVAVVKNAVLAQHAILRKHISPDLSRVPRMLAVYKEVEDFWYGDGACPGLREWEELKDVIFLLSDDNFGNLRTLPQPGDPPHPGGYGMYYHFDYHGWPISYEWLNGNPLPKIWEQMTAAWDHGVREMWIVNVGDLKGTELPLSYFLALAYDFDAWGSAAPNRTEDFLRQWMARQFGGWADGGVLDRLCALTEGWSRLNALRRPEALTPETYHPVHFREGERIWRWAEALEKSARRLGEAVPARLHGAYWGMVGMPALLTANLAQMNIEAGWNAALAEWGCVSANALGGSVRERIGWDKMLTGAFHALGGGKWNHMLDSAHVGFRTWDDHDWRYPAVRTVAPIPGGKALVKVRGSDSCHIGRHWQDKGPLVCDNFLDPAADSAALDIHSRGDTGFRWHVRCDAAWLAFSPGEGRVDPDGSGFGSCAVTVDRAACSAPSEALVRVEIAFDDGTETDSEVLFRIGAGQADGAPPALYLGRIAVDAAGYGEKHDGEKGCFRVIRGLGRTGDAVKAFPSPAAWSREEDRPWLAYPFQADSGGRYTLELYTLSRNPLTRGDRLTVDVSINGGEPVSVQTVSDSFRTGDGNEEWGRAVLGGARVSSVDLPVRRGGNCLRIFPVSPNVALERLVIRESRCPSPASYLGPPDTAGTK